MTPEEGDEIDRHYLTRVTTHNHNNSIVCDYLQAPCELVTTNMRHHNVNAVAPDWIPLGPDKENPPSYSKAVLESRVFKRHMDPEDAVGAVLFLASSESEFITGITLPVSGGSYFV